MALTNTEATWGGVARSLHWLTALLILTAIPLGLIANDMAYDTSDALAAKARLFSLHKTVGVAAFAVALLRIIWALVQPHPAALHPGRRLETALAGAVHWALYLSLVIVPLSGWVHHAATTGFAPILWPFGQSLPLVPQSLHVAETAAALHFVFTKVLIVAILLHVAGALKHHVIDRDDTLRRMVSGRITAPPPAPAGRKSRAPLLAALAIYAAGAGLALSLPAPEGPATTPALAEVASDWTVTEGTLSIGVQQMGQAVTGSFADWTAAIRFDPAPTEGPLGDVAVTVNIASLTLGSVTTQALAPDLLDAAGHPTATFTAPLTAVPGGGYVASGTLTLRGVAAPLDLPFTLDLQGDTARMTGQVTLDRRTFAVGETYGDEKSVGFPVTVDVTLTATRAK